MEAFRARKRIDVASRARLSQILVIALIFAGLAYLGITLTRDQSRIAAVWLPNAVVVALALRHEKFDLRLAFACFSANILADLLVGDTISKAVGLSAVNAVEIILTCIGMRRLGHVRPDMANSLHLIAFTAVGGVLVPIVSGLLAALILGPAQSFDVSLWINWSLTDALGMLLLAPSIWVVIAAWQRRDWLSRQRLVEWALILSASLAVFVLLFTQSRFPLLFVATPMVLLAAFRLGGLGAAVVTIMVAIVAWTATMAGLGPIALVRGDMADRLHVLQGFLVVNFGMSLPVAAALAGRAAIARALADSEMRFKRMAEAAPVGIFRADAKGNVTYVNEAWCAKIGMTVEQSLGDGWRSAILNVEDYESSPPWTGFTKPGDVRRRIARFRAADGGELWCETVNSAEFDEHGTITGFIGAVVDITEQRRIEAALIERDKQLSLLANNATDAVFRLTLEGRCLYASPSAKDLLGIEPQFLIGVSLLDRFHPDDDAPVRETFAALADGSIENRIVAYRSELMRRPGTYRWLEANCGLVRDAETGLPLEIIASIRDVSANKALESDLRVARIRAEQAAAAKSAFLANMSHEIRTPMNGVIGFTELLSQSDLTDEQRRHVALIADSGRAMMRLLNDILDIAKVEAGQMQLVEEPVEIREKLRAVLQLMEPMAHAKGVALRVTVDETVPRFVTGDRLRLRQILLNLIGNAVKFTDHGHVAVAVTVSSGLPMPELRIDVEDSGLGIPADKLASIFDKFVQSDGSIVRKFGGTGLGLSITTQLIDLMQGRITVASEAGKGSVFSVHLPLRVSEAAPMSLTENQPPSFDSVIPGGNQPVRLLVAEDHDINQELIRGIARQLNFEVDIAANGAEAIDMVERASAEGNMFDLVLMDVQMPILDGLEATRILRGRGFEANRLPIVALTANAYLEDVEACRLAGMQAHLAKPLRIDALQQVINDYAARPHRSDSAPLTENPTAVVTAQPGLQEKYRQRKQQTLDAVARLCEVHGSTDNEYQTVIDLLHKLAGIAGMFGEAALGEAAAELERDLGEADADRRYQVIAAGWQQLKRAA